MHPLRLIVVFAFVVCLAVAVILVVLVGHRAGHPPEEESTLASLGLAMLTFFALFSPPLSIYLWAVHRARETDEVTQRAMRVAEGRYEELVTREALTGETGDIARAVDGLRSLILRQLASFEEQKALNRKVLDSLVEGVIAINSSRRVVFINPRAREMFGVEGPVTGEPLTRVLRHQGLLSAFDRALAGEPAAERIELGERQIDIWTAPVGAEQIAAIASIVDVTRVAKLERIRSDFLADFSHEVRTPLAALRAAAESFGGGGLDPAQEERLRAIITRQVGRLERLVQDLSELSRIESGQLVLNREEIDLRALLFELRDELPPTRRMAVAGPPVRAVLDPIRTEQIFSNLLDNAFKYGEPDSEVSIELFDEPGHVTVRVSDHGPGIAREDLERVFHRFYRADRSRSQVTPGVGLGLSITRHLVLLQGGTIRAESIPSKGTTFEVRLPKNTSAPPTTRGA